MSSTRLELIIEAPRDLVYAALTTATDVQTWMVPTGMTSQVHEFDAREGGAFRISLTYDAPTNAGKSSAQTDTFHGVFVGLVPGERVVQTIEFETDDVSMQGAMTVTYTMFDGPHGATRLVATHANVPRGVRPEDNELGWSMSLGKLKTLVESRVG